MTQSTWLRGLSRPVPTRTAGVRLSLLSLDASAADVADCRLVLSADECGRADRFRFERDRRRFLVCRALLRHLLADELDVAPECVRFAYGQFGKPAVGDPVLRFNVSHSDERALVAITRGADVGVDIERQNPLTDMESLSRQVFSPLEQQAFDRVAPPLRVGAFYAGWTRKEAYVKARGDGLQRALDAFDVELTPGAPARLIEVRGEPGEAGRWDMESLDIVPGYAAALCVERPRTSESM